MLWKSIASWVVRWQNGWAVTFMINVKAIRSANICIVLSEEPSTIRLYSLIVSSSGKWSIKLRPYLWFMFQDPCNLPSSFSCGKFCALFNKIWNAIEIQCSYAFKNPCCIFVLPFLSHHYPHPRYFTIIISSISLPFLFLRFFIFLFFVLC